VALGVIRFGRLVPHIAVRGCAARAVMRALVAACGLSSRRGWFRVAKVDRSAGGRWEGPGVAGGVGLA
jgi:hypothetical protein